MNRRRSFRSAAIVVALLATGQAIAQGGGPTTIPGGPNDDNDSPSSLRSYEQLVAANQQSVQTSGGTATYNVARWKSNSGRDVPYVVIGRGPTKVLLIAQQHGDEMETSDSAVNLIRTLVNDSAASKAIRGASNSYRRTARQRRWLRRCESRRHAAHGRHRHRHTTLAAELGSAVHVESAAGVLSARARLRHPIAITASGLGARWTIPTFLTSRRSRAS